MLLKWIYKLRHKGVADEDIPYWYRRSFFNQVWHTMRKWICQVWAPNATITGVRIVLYRICGFKIGKGCFIGMKCYFDDLCVEKMEIGNNVTISYGVYFSCHSPYQEHHKMVIDDGAYIGMRASIIATRDIVIGKNACVGAMSLVNKSIPDGATAVGVPCRVISGALEKAQI